MWGRGENLEGCVVVGWVGGLVGVSIDERVMIIRGDRMECTG
jgi:hypothetical protein